MNEKMNESEIIEKKENNSDLKFYSTTFEDRSEEVDLEHEKFIKQMRKIDCDKISQFDDILCDILIDNLFLGFRTHKLNKFNENLFKLPPRYNQYNTFSEAILSIIKRTILNPDVKDGIDKAYEELFSFLNSDTLTSNYDLTSLISTQLIKYPSFKEYFNSLTTEELKCFEEHTKKYLSMYHVKAGFQLIETDRYKVTGKKECCLIATKEWNKGDLIKYCSGVLCPITSEELKKLEGEDFSIMFSAVLKCNALFLGPGRFVNHDCQPNCEFVSYNRASMIVNFRVIRDIKLGEELTVFYSDSYFGINNCDCLCESCEKKQLGGFSKPLSNDASSSSENDNINHPVSTVMRHRRRAQPMSFKINFEIEVNDDYHCNICGRLISEINGICVGCLRHHKIFNLIWPHREKEKRSKKIENKHLYDDLSDFKDFFFNLIQNKEVDEIYDNIYDFYNKNMKLEEPELIIDSNSESANDSSSRKKENNKHLSSNRSNHNFNKNDKMDIDDNKNYNNDKNKENTEHINFIDNNINGKINSNSNNNDNNNNNNYNNNNNNNSNNNNSNNRNNSNNNSNSNINDINNNINSNINNISNNDSNANDNTNISNISNSSSISFINNNNKYINFNSNINNINNNNNNNNHNNNSNNNNNNNNNNINKSMDIYSLNNNDINNKVDNVYLSNNKIRNNNNDITNVNNNNRNQIIRHKNRKNLSYINNDNLINEFLNGYGDGYSSKKQNRKRRRIMDSYLKELNRVSKKKKFFMYNCSPSRLSYDTIAYYGFSDYTIDLNLDNYPQYMLFYEVTKSIMQHKKMDNKIYTYNMLNYPLLVKNSLDKNNKIVDSGYIYMDPLVTPEILFKTVFNDEIKKRHPFTLNGVDLEFIKPRSIRNKVQQYLSFSNRETKEVGMKLTRYGKDESARYINLNTFISNLYSFYDDYWEGFRNNNYSLLSNSLINNDKYIKNLNILRIYQINEHIDCFSPWGWYKAKIKDIEFNEKNILIYYIHYINWGERYDTSVSPEKLRITHEEFEPEVTKQNATIGTR